jgi:hypothetical protein
MPALNKFKIHPPLPLNPRESKQLLNLLTTSFRQQLDTEHGFGKFKSSGGATGQKLNHQDHKGNQRPRRRSDPGSRPTDRHLHSILTNPLFNYSPNEEGSKSARGPMEIFDLAVVRGMMNTNYARACLNAKKREIVQSSVLNVRDGMRDSRAGLKVLKWLISSGTANDIDFLKNEGFAEILMEYMVAEGLQEAAWAWIKKAFEGIPHYCTKDPYFIRQEARRDIVRPLMLLVRAEATGPVSMDAAYMILSRAAGYLNGMSVEKVRLGIGPPGCFLSHQATMLSSERPMATESNFESFIGLVPTMTIDTEYHFAHLNLLHPSTPTAELALAYLQKMESKQSSSAVEQYLRNGPRDHNLIQLSLDTAKFLLERDRFADAEWVMGYLRSNYPKQLGLEQRRQLEQAKAEASSLQLLEGLSLA